VGSSKVQEFSTTDSIQLAIQEIRNKEAGGRPNVIPSGGAGALLLNTQVTLIVSATVISWYNAKTKVRFLSYSLVEKTPIMHKYIWHPISKFLAVRMAYNNRVS
jgi:hypothetical protein